MMDYLRGDKETLSVITEVEGKRQDFFNEQDRFHMREVRDIFAGGLRLRTAALVAAAVSLLILYMCRADVKKILPQTYQVAVGIVLIPTAGIGIAAAIMLKYLGAEQVMICDKSDFRLNIARNSV